MQLIGQQVEHSIFGRGTVTDLAGQILTVHFETGDKRFLYPDVFSSFLTLKNRSMQDEINQKYNLILKKEEMNREKEYEQLKHREQLRSMKIYANSQAVFTVELAGAEKLIRNGTVSAGCYLSGYAKGEPRMPEKIRPNSACLFSGIPAGGTEADRVIVGAFMAADDFWGEKCTDGIIRAHDRFRICVPEKDALPFWNYFRHDGAFPRWGRSAFKYFSNDAMQHVLFDLKNIVSGRENAAVMNGFYEYFCEINRLPDYRAPVQTEE